MHMILTFQDILDLIGYFKNNDAHLKIIFIKVEFRHEII